MNIASHMRLVVLCLACLGIAACGDDLGTVTIPYTQEVEISPDRWLTVDAGSTVIARASRFTPDPERSLMAFDWGGYRVEWEGKEIPISLRIQEEDLYIIGFDRSDMRKCRFRYYQLGAGNSQFEEITCKEFPPSIATQNLWLNEAVRHRNVYVREGGNVLVDTWAMLRKLDVSSPAFGLSFTARIWRQIEEGTEYYVEANVPRELLERYVRKHKPVPLPTIVREGKAKATPQEIQPNKTQQDKPR